MEIDPHTFQQIIRRIEQQMRCPQCGKRMPVLLPSVHMADEEFFLLQLKCDTCDAFVVLNASLQGAHHFRPTPENRLCTNASSSLQMKEEEIAALRTALEQHGGSFEKMFQKAGPAAEAADTRIA